MRLFINKEINSIYSKNHSLYAANESIKESDETRQINDNDYKIYSQSISALNKPMLSNSMQKTPLSFLANNRTAKLKPENKELRKKIFELDGWSFEKLAGYIFENAKDENENKLFDNVEVTSASGDNGVDVILDKNTSNGIKRTLVQCKHYKNLVRTSVIDDLLECRDKKEFNNKNNEAINEINCLMIASSGVSDSVFNHLSKINSKISPSKYEIMNLDDLISYAKKYRVEINDEILKPYIEETNQRNKCRKELLEQTNRIKEMINNPSYTLDDVIKILDNEYRAKYPLIVKGNYIRDFIDHTFKPPECFKLLKQEGYKFEKNMSTTNQTIFFVTKDIDSVCKTFVVYYSDCNSPMQNSQIQQAIDGLNNAKENENDGLILVSKSGFKESLDIYENLKNLDIIYTIADNKLEEYAGIPEKIKPVTDLLEKEGYKFEKNMSIKNKTIFSVTKDINGKCKTFVVYYSDSSKPMENRQIQQVIDSLNNAKENENDGLILVSKGGFCKSLDTYESLKSLDIIYTIADNKLEEYTGIPEKIKSMIDLLNLLEKEGYKFEKNMNTTKQTIFSVTKDINGKGKTFVVYYSDCNSPMQNSQIQQAIDGLNNAKENENDGLILVSKSGFKESLDIYENLKNLDITYTIADNKLKEYTGIPEKIKPMIDLLNLLEKEGYKFEKNMSTHSGRTIFSVAKDINGKCKTFVVYYCDGNSPMQNIQIKQAIEGLNNAKENENDRLILVSKGGFRESLDTFESLKNLDIIYTIENDKLEEYTGIPEKINPITDLLEKEGYKFEKNMGTHSSQTIFSVAKDINGKCKTFVVYYSDCNSPMSNEKINKAIYGLNNAKEKENDGLILVSKSGFCSGLDICENLKKIDVVYTIVDNKLEEYTGIPEKIKPVTDLLEKEGYKFEKNMSMNSSQTIFSVAKDINGVCKTFVVYYSNQDRTMSTQVINKILQSIDNLECKKDGIILVTKKGMTEKCKEEKQKEGFLEQKITDKDGNEFFVYTKYAKDIVKEQERKEREGREGREVA